MNGDTHNAMQLVVDACCGDIAARLQLYRVFDAFARFN